MQQNRIAIIPARGGSKRLPRKNIMLFLGKPMIEWTIEAALQCGLFSKVLVSTDDDEIRQVSLRAGAHVPFLREIAFDDHASSSEATLAALRQAEQYWNTAFTSITQLMANCPLRNCVDIQDAMQHFEQSGATAQISCFKFGWMNPWWAAHLNSEGKPTYAFPDIRLSRSQDLPHLYCPTGAIWITNAASLKQHGTFYIPEHVFHPLHQISAVDIDDQDDLVMAEAFAVLRQQQLVQRSA
ncbi:MAG: acylneuraminate cytidylyltransferase family protein [Gammaproteobacteria bacterium]|nr:acylneuraminate cytidylyltransferase family protein [Gammaproteobacteria bacterium]